MSIQPCGPWSDLSSRNPAHAAAISGAGGKRSSPIPRRLCGVQADQAGATRRSSTDRWPPTPPMRRSETATGGCDNPLHHCDLGAEQNRGTIATPRRGVATPRSPRSSRGAPAARQRNRTVDRWGLRATLCPSARLPMRLQATWNSCQRRMPSAGIRRAPLSSVVPAPSPPVHDHLAPASGSAPDSATE